MDFSISTVHAMTFIFFFVFFLFYIFFFYFFLISYFVYVFSSFPYPIAPNLGNRDFMARCTAKSSFFSAAPPLLLSLLPRTSCTSRR
jgi:hypothetical protein